MTVNSGTCCWGDLLYIPGRPLEHRTKDPSAWSGATMATPLSCSSRPLPLSKKITMHVIQIAVFVKYMHTKWWRGWNVNTRGWCSPGGSDTVTVSCRKLGPSILPRPNHSSIQPLHFVVRWGEQCPRPVPRLSHHPSPIKMINQLMNRPWLTL